MKATLPILMMAMTATGVFAATPVIDNVTMTQAEGSRKVIISYKLTGEDAIVTAEVFHNGETIGLDKVVNMTGAVNAMVTAGEDVKEIQWRPNKTWPNKEYNDGSISVKLTAWTKACPPPYMAVNLEAQNIVRYYVSSNAVPGGIQDRRYKTTWMLFKKIPAAGVMCRLGSSPKELDATSDTCMMTFTQDFYAGVFEVTRKQYSMVATDPSKSTAFEDAEICPVTNVSYDDFRGKVSDNPSVNWPTTDRTTVSESSVLHAFRSRTGLLLDLPTEAQWEFAARAGVETLYQNGARTWDAAVNKVMLEPVAWYSDTSDGKPHPVGKLDPNAFGLYDMIGNAMEWCLDWEGAWPMEAVDYAGKTSGNSRMMRGTCFSWNDATARFAWRKTNTSDNGSSENGVRLFLTLD